MRGCSVPLERLWYCAKSLLSQREKHTERKRRCNWRKPIEISVSMCMQSIVWFSGPSAINLIDVVPYGRYVEIGCNHFQEMRSVQHTVAYDRQIIDQFDHLDENCEYWTHARWSKPPLWKRIHKQKYDSHIGDSGQLAVQLSQQLGMSHTYIIGCDWGVTDISIQDHRYTFRGYQPPKYTNVKDKWLSRLDQSAVTWVHLEPQPWMHNFLHHSDFLDLATSSRH